MIASLREMHTNLGRPSNHALARAIRVTGGSAAAVRAALQLRCDVCESQQHPDPTCQRDFAQTESFGDTAAIDLFVLADYEGNQLSFIILVLLPQFPASIRRSCGTTSSNIGSLLVACREG